MPKNDARGQPRDRHPSQRPRMLLVAVLFAVALGFYLGAFFLMGE